MRRTAIHSSMKRDFDQLWLSLQHELCETIERSMEEHVQLTRTTHEHVRKVEAESLSKARVASEVRVQQEVRLRHRVLQLLVDQKQLAGLAV